MLGLLTFSRDVQFRRKALQRSRCGHSSAVPGSKLKRSALSPAVHCSSIRATAI